MLLEVTLGDETTRRLVSVNDELQFIGTYRAAMLNSLAKPSGNNVLQFLPKDDEQAALIKSLRVHLKNTGFAELPETELEIAALYRRFGD